MCEEESGSPDLCLVDIGKLKEHCRCLITWSSDQPSGLSGNGSEVEFARIAHYPVREFLESDRTSESASLFYLQPEKLYKDVLNSVFGRSNVTKLLQVPRGAALT